MCPVLLIVLFVVYREIEHTDNEQPVLIKQFKTNQRPWNIGIIHVKKATWDYFILTECRLIRIDTENWTTSETVLVFLVTKVFSLYQF